jgi:protein gp37
MSDLFHHSFPDEYIELVFRVMCAADWHTFQVLTKRSRRMASLLETKLRFAANKRHIWWGVSVEDRKHGLPRLESLRASQAGVRFLSIEPLLESLGAVDLKGFDWVIVGGESGPHCRPLDPEWVRDLQNRCKTAGAKFFFKQWGGVQKSKMGRLLDGRTYDEIPPVISAPVMERAERLAAIEKFLAEAAKISE